MANVKIWNKRLVQERHKALTDYRPYRSEVNEDRTLFNIRNILRRGLAGTVGTKFYFNG